MPKLALLSTNMTGGEFAPSLGGRVDVAKYNNAVARMENFHPRVQGGAVSRPGSAYVGQAKGDGKLFAFVYSRELGYQLEFTAGALRFWRHDRTQIMAGDVPLEIATPYTFDDLTTLNREQAEDTMFLFHTAHPPMRLRRVADTAWRLDVVPFSVAPFAEQGYQPEAAGFLSVATVGTGRTLTTSTPTFLASDIGRDIVSGFGAATITALTNASTATVDIVSEFASTTLVGGTWALDGSPRAFIYPSAKGPVGSTVSIAAALPRQASVTIGGSGATRTLTASASVFAAGDVGRRFYADAGVLLIGSQGGTTADGTLESTADFLSATYPAGGWGITGDAFHASDVGSHIRANGTGGLYRIVSIPDATTAMAEIRTAATALVAVPPGAWSLEDAAWSSVSGYPGAGALYEQRLWFGGTRRQPQTLWVSRIGDFLNFESGLNDDAAFSYTLNTHQRNQIRHLPYTKRLFAMTQGLEVSLRGGNEKAIGPTNIQKVNESNNGVGPVRPVVIEDEVLFVQGAGRKIRAMGYTAAKDGFNSPDRTVYADHVTASGIVDMAYQAEPSPLLYAVRADGVMAVCAYSMDQEVVGWSRYLTAGAYRSVSVLPAPTTDAVWTLMRRTVNGTAQHFIEVFDEALSTDAAVLLAANAPKAQWHGFSHLNGTLVSVKADGVNQGSFIVAGDGSITIARNAATLEAGLAFVPEIEMLPPEVGGSTGTGQGSNLTMHEVVVRVLDTDTLEINGEQTDFRRFGASLLDRPPPGYDGDYRSVTLADEVYKAKLVIRQPHPYRAHILAVVRKVTVNDK